jgi:hypothetical protein
MKVWLSRTDSTDMHRRAFARHRIGAALLLGLSLRAPRASAEPGEPDETRVGTVEGVAPEELPSAAERPLIPDRARVPYLYQFGFDPSVIHQGLIDRVDLYPGGSPARFGRFAGGGVSAPTRGPEPGLPGEANLRSFDVGGLIETPFARGRGSLLPWLLSLLSPELKLDYRDYQTRATYEPIARDRFSVFGFGSYDLLGEKTNGLLTRLGDACRPRITFTW